MPIKAGGDQAAKIGSGRLPGISREDDMSIPVRSAVLLVLGAMLAQADTGAAQGVGDAAAGHRLASTWCAHCHRISARDRDPARVPPDFGAVAAMPQLTEMSLRIFLQTPHGEMPRYQFTRTEMDDVIAYIMSLRSP
jgi:mono/diheme cytochrome c family protein